MQTFEIEVLKEGFLLRHIVNRQTTMYAYNSIFDVYMAMDNLLKTKQENDPFLLHTYHAADMPQISGVPKAFLCVRDGSTTK
jgi:hypothetical protein